MEPRIQYAQTKDGVSIAYWTMGEGMPLVMTPFIPGHAQLVWQFPQLRRYCESVAEGRRLVSYDSRGTGLSDRNVSDFSPDALVLDLEAVVDHLDLHSFSLMGITHVGTAAIAYAAGHPERVTRLALIVCYARGASSLTSPATQAARTLLDSDWEMYTEAIGHFAFGFAEAELAQRYAVYMRESITHESWRVATSQWEKSDVSDLLPRVTSPTLVVHPRHTPMFPLDEARYLASRIPDAQLTVIEGKTAGLTMDTLEAGVAAVNEFLGEGEEAAEAGEPEAGAFRTVLFTDVEGSTALTQRLGDAKARGVLREHERIVREALKSHGGSELKTMGDGFMASFSSATRALESAIAMQRAFAAHNESAAEPILVRVGLNAGEPIAEEEDLFGTAVIMAARIAAKAKGGEILTSDTVRGLVAGKKFLFADRGEVALHGFDEPVRLFELRWREEK